MGEPFSPEHTAKCVAAMSKPAPIAALRLIASGRIIVEIQKDGDILVDRFDGESVRDPDHPDRKMGLAGAWPLFCAGMIDQFGIVTAAGHEALARHQAPQDGQDGGER